MHVEDLLPHKATTYELESFKQVACPLCKGEGKIGKPFVGLGDTPECPTCFGHGKVWQPK